MTWLDEILFCAETDQLLAVEEKHEQQDNNNLLN